MERVTKNDLIVLKFFAALSKYKIYIEHLVVIIVLILSFLSLTAIHKMQAFIFLFIPIILVLGFIEICLYYDIYTFEIFERNFMGLKKSRKYMKLVYQMLNYPKLSMIFDIEDDIRSKPDSYIIDRFKKRNILVCKAFQKLLGDVYVITGYQNSVKKIYVYSWKSPEVYNFLNIEIDEFVFENEISKLNEINKFIENENIDETIKLIESTDFKGSKANNVDKYRVSIQIKTLIYRFFEEVKE